MDRVKRIVERSGLNQPLRIKQHLKAFGLSCKIDEKPGISTIEVFNKSTPAGTFSIRYGVVDFGGESEQR